MNRRPIRMRDVEFFHRLARVLARWGMTPNMVSIASVFFAGGGAACLWLARDASQVYWIVCYLAAPALMGLRGVCNLIDGLIAVEGGKKTKSGEVFNDFPDRIADVLLFVGAGYGAVESGVGIPAGWFSGCLALMTAYTRLLGGAVGAKQYFQGPMGKPTRMAVLSLGSLATLAERLLLGSTWSLVASLVVIALGSVMTVVRRLRLIVRELEG